MIRPGRWQGKDAASGTCMGSRIWNARRSSDRPVHRVLPTPVFMDPGPTTGLTAWGAPHGVRLPLIPVGVGARGEWPCMRWLSPVFECSTHGRRTPWQRSRVHAPMAGGAAMHAAPAACQTATCQDRAWQRARPRERPLTEPLPIANHKQP